MRTHDHGHGERAPGTVPREGGRGTDRDAGGRRRQAGTVLGSAALALLLAAGSIAGLRSLLRDQESFGPGDYEVFERTATIEAFTVTSPSDWFLVNAWPLSMRSQYATLALCPEGNPNTEVDCFAPLDQVELDPSLGLPMLQLTNDDIGLGSTACGTSRPDLAVLYVALDYESDAAGINPPYFPPPPGLPPEGEGPCGHGRYARFTVNGQPFFAWVRIGANVSDADRAALTSTYEMMSAIEDWTPEPPAHVTPGYVIAGGASPAGDEWRIEARPGTEVELSLFAPGPSGAPQISLGDEPVYWCCSSMTAPGEAGDPIFGAVQPEAAAVEFRPSDGRDPIRGTILPSPPSLGADFDFFFIEGTLGLSGDVEALGLEGAASISPPPIAEPRGEVVELSGTYLGRTWTARFTGSFADGSACIRVTIDGALEPLCETNVDTSLAGTQPSMHGWATTGLNHLLAGSVPPEVVEIRFTSDDGTDPLTQFRCRMGPLGWTDPDRKVCVLALPPEGSGIFEYLDADGGVLFEEGMGWGVSEPDVAVPMPVDPVHGGTYWAVYPWVGAPGSREADDVSAQLLAEFGIEAFAGDLSCDDGAAEALGTDAPQGIGVYFETEDEANEFALQAGLLGHEADPVIAEVTTFCLD